MFFVGFAVQNICTAYGEGALSKRTFERCFAKFRSGNENLEDEPHPRRPSELADEDLESLLKANPRITTREMAEELGCSHTAVESHLHKIGKVSKLGTWVPHELSESNLNQRVTICSSLLSRFTREPFWIKSSLATRNGFSTPTCYGSASGSTRISTRNPIQNQISIQKR